MKVPIERRLVNPRGKQTLYRNRHLHARELKLSDAEYRLLDLYGAVSGWDTRYSGQYETVQATDKEIAEILGCDKTTVSKTRKKLMLKNLVRKDGPGDYKILRIFNKEVPIDGKHVKVADFQLSVANSKQEVAKIQEDQGYDSTSTISSSKEVYVFIRTEQEYKKVSERVNLLTQKLDEIHGWLSDDPKLIAMVGEQQRLANAMLMYEIEHDLLPDYL